MPCISFNGCSWLSGLLVFMFCFLLYVTHGWSRPVGSRRRLIHGVINSFIHSCGAMGPWVLGVCTLHRLVTIQTNNINRCALQQKAGTEGLCLHKKATVQQQTPAYPEPGQKSALQQLSQVPHAHGQ